MFKPGTRVQIKDTIDLKFINTFIGRKNPNTPKATKHTVFIIEGAQHYEDGSVISIENGPSNVCWTYHREFKLAIPRKNLIGGRLV